MPEYPDGWPGMVPVRDGDLDADGDGTADTVVVAREAGGAWVFTDTDGDGFADQLLDLAAEADDEDVPVLDALMRLLTGRGVQSGAWSPDCS